MVYEYAHAIFYGSTKRTSGPLVLQGEGSVQDRELRSGGLLQLCIAGAFVADRLFSRTPDTLYSMRTACAVIRVQEHLLAQVDKVKKSFVEAHKIRVLEPHDSAVKGTPFRIT
eukprot:8864360-Pyramimonas_sp.AAC.2